MKIIPTILEKEFNKAEWKLKLIKDLTSWVQIDVIDNIFTSGKTFELELIKNIEEPNNFLWEIHLMVKEPINWIGKSIFANATRIVGQVEMMSDRYEFITRIKDKGFEAGLAFNIDTEIDEIPEGTDEVLLMARPAGFENHEFDLRVIDKIEKLKKVRDEKEMTFLIGVDGGVNWDNINLLKEKGVDVIYSGSMVFNGNVAENWQEINNTISNL